MRFPMPSPRALASACLLLAPACALAGAPVDALRACMGANLPDALRVQTVEVTSWDRSGQERVIKGRIFGARENARSRVMALVEQPHDLAGTAFLVREGNTASEMYVFLPTVNRVKRLAGNTMNGKLWGTDFSYSEFRRVAGVFEDGSASLVGAATVEGRPVDVLALTPAAGQQDPYDSILVRVDRQTCVPLQADFRKGQAVRKQLTVPAAGLRQSGKLWYPSELTLRDLVEGTRTRLRVVGVVPGARLSARYFNPQQFHSAR